MPTQYPSWEDVLRTHQDLIKSVHDESVEEMRFRCCSTWVIKNKPKFDILFKCGLVAYDLTDLTYIGGYLLTEVPTEEHENKFKCWLIEQHMEDLLNKK
jgi:hypothetical protein